MTCNFAEISIHFGGGRTCFSGRSQVRKTPNYQYWTHPEFDEELVEGKRPGAIGVERCEGLFLFFGGEVCAEVVAAFGKLAEVDRVAVVVVKNAELSIK